VGLAAVKTVSKPLTSEPDSLQRQKGHLVPQFTVLIRLHRPYKVHVSMHRHCPHSASVAGLALYHRPGLAWPSTMIAMHGTAGTNLLTCQPPPHCRKLPACCWPAESAYFWADGANTSAITGHWLDVAREVRHTCTSHN
jgi:hypothetical protein